MLHGQREKPRNIPYINYTHYTHHMKSYNIRPLIFLLAAVLVIAAGFTLFANRAGAPAPGAQEAPKEASVTITIESLYEAKQISIVDGQTLLSLLRALNEADPALALKTKEYAGLGTLIESMHALTNGMGGEYWQYTVNGVMPQIGASDYALKDGDKVEWFFGSSQQ